ncbi:MAG: hypothetical protein ABIT70_11470, partial [Sulfuriferula sp.]
FLATGLAAVFFAAGFATTFLAAGLAAVFFAAGFATTFLAAGLAAAFAGTAFLVAGLVLLFAVVAITISPLKVKQLSCHFVQSLQMHFQDVGHLRLILLSTPEKNIAKG